MRKTLFLFGKAAISAALLYLALNWVNIGTVTNQISHIDTRWVALGISVMFLQQLLLTARWRQILVQCGQDSSFARLFRINMVGAFFSQMLPSSVGGDAARIWLVAKKANWRVATYSVLLDRVVGVFALAVVVVICLPWTLNLVSNPIGRSAILLLGLGSLAGSLLLVAFPSERIRFLQRWFVTRHLSAAAKVGRTIIRSQNRFVLVFGLSILVHLLSVIVAWCAAHSAGVDLPVLYALFLLPPVILTTVFPISISGWGVRESAMIVAFAYAGLSQSDGLVVSLLFGGTSLVVGLIGGLVWILQPERLEPQANSFAAVSD
jgi:uncharacterized protein (TIRG00374 family)